MDESIDKYPIIAECSTLIFEAVAPDGDGPLRIVVGNYKNQNSFTVPDFIQRLVEHPELLDNNLHCGVSTYDGNGHKKENTTSTCGIFTDTDYGSLGHSDPSKFATREEALAHLNGLPLTPSALWDSGHGVQGVYLLERPVLYAETGRAAMLLEAKKLIRDVTYSDNDVSPVLLFRMPGSINDKREEFPDTIPVRGAIIKSLDKTCRYSLEEIIVKLKPLANELSPSERPSCLNSSGPGKHFDSPRGFAEQRPDAARVAAALDFLKPDCCYEDWRNIGMALQSWDPELGLELWDTWSAKGGKYKPGGCRAKWGTFKSDGGITIATLFDLAKKNGFVFSGSPRKATADAVDKIEMPVNDPVDMARKGTPYPMTDAGNAERFAYYNKGKVCYDTKAKAWRVFNGKYWRIKPRIYKLGIDTARRIRQEAEVAPDKVSGDKKLGQVLFNHAIRTESKKCLDAMLAIAESMLAVEPDKFDADTYLFNCQNGTIDLKTGQLRPHDRKDYITKISPVEYDPDVDISLLMAFLKDLAGGDMAVIGSLQKLQGYTLTGDISEETVQMAIGRENSGKTTLFESMKAAWGTYAVTINFETLVRKKNDSGVSNDIARLAGARLVSGDEVDEGKSLAEGLLKAVSGGNMLVARFLYGEYFEFHPQFKLWLASNFAPRVSAEDGAVWRRLIRLPFDHIVPKEKRDKSLKKKLKDPAIGGKQILRFAVEGCLLWQREGLALADAIVTATEKYREECDTMKDFFDECCQFIPEAWTSSKGIQEAYKRYCTEYSIRYPLGFMKLQERLKIRNCQPEKRYNQRGWCGISLIPVQVGTGCTPLPGGSPYEDQYREVHENGVQGVQRCTSENVNVGLGNCSLDDKKQE
ncbi:MAG: phage/plasmid primase, P4 family [Victivallales bacterium]